MRVAVGRPARREQRLVAGDDLLRVVAVGVGDQQGVARALLGDVGDARGEHAGIAGQRLVDHVGDAVRGGAELRRRDRVDLARQHRLLDHVDQLEAHLDAAVGLRAHRADDDRIGAAGAPVGGAHVLRARGTRHAGVVDEAEQARALQVRTDDAGDAEREACLALERDDRNGNRRARAADDLDGELRARHRQRHERDDKEEESAAEDLHRVARL